MYMLELGISPGYRKALREVISYCLGSNAHWPKTLNSAYKRCTHITNINEPLSFHDTMITVSLTIFTDG